MMSLVSSCNLGDTGIWSSGADPRGRCRGSACIFLYFPIFCVSIVLIFVGCTLSWVACTLPWKQSWIRPWSSHTSTCNLPTECRDTKDYIIFLYMFLAVAKKPVRGCSWFPKPLFIFWKFSKKGEGRVSQWLQWTPKSDTFKGCRVPYVWFLKWSWKVWCPFNSRS